MDMRLVLVTHPSKEHAERITRGVIDAKLAACVLVTDVKSFYNWEGKLNEDDEVVTILKTSDEKVTNCKNTLKQITIMMFLLSFPSKPMPTKVMEGG